MVSISTGKESKQDYSTPPEFIRAVEKKMGEPLSFDLAASLDNPKAKDFFTEEDNSLDQDWSKLYGNLWLNPPFKDIQPWAKKCFLTSYHVDHRLRIFLLVPASVGSNWFKTWVAPRADVYFLNGRLSFDGKGPFPKDCMLCVYEPLTYYVMNGNKMKIWEWKNDIS